MNTSPTCECSRPKRKGERACPRCMAIEERQQGKTVTVGVRIRRAEASAINRACDRFFKSRGMTVPRPIKFGKETR